MKNRYFIGKTQCKEGQNVCFASHFFIDYESFSQNGFKQKKISSKNKYQANASYLFCISSSCSYSLGLLQHVMTLGVFAASAANSYEKKIYIIYIFRYNRVPQFEVLTRNIYFIHNFYVATIISLVKIFEQKPKCNIKKKLSTLKSVSTPSNLCESSGNCARISSEPMKMDSK